MLKPRQLEVFAILLAIVMGRLRGEPQRLQKRSLLFGNHKVENFSEIVTRNGYSAEEHSVTTEDGYVLAVHRISGGPRSPPAPKKPTVLLLHGTGATSDYWILQGPGSDLAFILVDEGFDVWCMNMRGNLYSRSHISLSPHQSQFWRFSWHEGGVYDLPATIDRALDVSGSDKITLIGHSMGSTIIFVLLSMRPEYNRKVDRVISLAPVASFHPRNQFRTASLTISAAIGTDFLKALPAVLDHYPAGISVDTMRHYLQLLHTGDFRLYDFGPKVNLIRYGSTIPPKYPLARITAPVFLYYGLEDPFATAMDVSYLEKNLINVDVKVAKQVPHPLFSHLDFIFGLDAKQLLYDELINIMKNRTTSS